MPEIIATGGGSDSDLKQSPLKTAWDKFSSLDRFSKTMVSTTVLFLVFATAITTITLSLRQYAGGGGIAKVEIHPGVVGINVGHTQALSTLAFDYNNNPVNSNVVYEWSMSSASSAGTLTKTIGSITELKALNAGCASLTVVARDGINTVTKSIIVAISESSDSVQNCGIIIAPTQTEATPTPYASGSAAICQPQSQTTKVGEVVKLTASGGNGSGSYYWYSNGYPSNSIEDIYTVSFDIKGDHPVALVASGYPTVYCNVSVVASLTPTPPPPLTMELNPIADAYVRSDYSGKNYGAGKALRVDGKPTVNGYLKFDLRKLSGATITGAKLGFYVLDVKGSGTPGTQSLVRVANTSWNESSINYRKAPNRTSVFSSYTNLKRNTYIYFDVTQWVKENYGKLASMAIINSSGNEAVLGAREQNNKYNRPTLAIEYRLAPTITPTPPVGNFYLKSGAINNYGNGKVGIVLSWSSMNGALKYNVYHKYNNYEEYGPAIFSTGALSGEAIVNGVLSNYFIVEACSASKCTKSNEVYVAPKITPTPTGFITRTPTIFPPSPTPTPF